MSLIVQKFGGTSLDGEERIEKVAQIVAQHFHKGDQLVVVLSAMAGETDRLLNLASKIAEQPDPRELDLLISTGEQVSIALLAMALLKRKIAAKSYTGAQAQILTDSQFNNAKILKIQQEKLLHDLAQHRVVIVAGFQGVDEHGNITTLGRGGSDLTAVALAAALNAVECQIYTDVEGVFTTDPQLVADAHLLREISWQEMLELASSGAKVLQARAVEFAQRHNVKVRVLSSFVEGNGTQVALEQPASSDERLAGIASSVNEVKIDITGLDPSLHLDDKILAALANAQVSFDMFVKVLLGAKEAMSFTVDVAHIKKVLFLLEEILQQHPDVIFKTNFNIAKISIVGVAMRSNPEILHKILATLRKHNIVILLCAVSEIKGSLCIAEEHLEVALQALHRVLLPLMVQATVV